MGFWSKAGKVALGVGKEAIDRSKKTLNEAQELSQEYENESTDFLKNKATSGRVTQQLAARKVLKNRGESFE